MPIHFNAIVKEETKNKIFEEMLSMDTQNPDNVWASQDKKKVITTKNIYDKLTNDLIAKNVYTMMVRDNAIEIVDVDFVLYNEESVKVLFAEKDEKESSESNEYYDVQIINDDVRFQIETVNRHVIEEEILNKEYDVYLSAFPFRFEIYNNIEEFNNKMFNEPMQVKGTDFKVHGFSEKFMGCGTALGEKTQFSFIIGKVKSIRNVETTIGETDIKFAIIALETAVGKIPVAVSNEIYDLSELKEDKTIIMYADVKANFVK